MPSAPTTAEAEGTRPTTGPPAAAAGEAPRIEQEADRLIAAYASLHQETVQDLLSATDGARVPEENEQVLEEFIRRFCPKETKADEAHRTPPPTVRRVIAPYSYI